jgi:hypothetical protein
MSYFIFDYLEFVDGEQTGPYQISVHSSDNKNHEQKVKDHLKKSLRERNPNAKRIEVVFMSIKGVSREQYLECYKKTSF